MPNPDIEAERRDFEAHARQKFHWGDEELARDERVVFPHYKVGTTFVAFKFWLAARALPVKVSEEMVERACRAMCALHRVDPDSDRNSDGRGGNFYTEVAWPPGMDRYWHGYKRAVRTTLTAALENDHGHP